MEMTKEKAIAIGKELNYQPIGNRLIVLAPKPSDTTKSGIIKSESIIAEEKLNSNFLYVVKLSNDESVQKSGIEVGDRVFTLKVNELPPLNIDTDGYLICETDLFKVCGYLK